MLAAAGEHNIFTSHSKACCTVTGTGPSSCLLSIGTRDEGSGASVTAAAAADAVAGKARAKKSRWGPDHPNSSSPVQAAAAAAASGKAWPPASGFKGVNSLRPPGTLLAAKQANSQEVAMGKQADSFSAILQHQDATQPPNHVSNGHDFVSPLPKHPDVAGYRSSPSPANDHYKQTSPRHARPSQTPSSIRHTASGRFSCSPSREHSRHSREHSRQPSQEKSQPSSRNRAMAREDFRPSGRDDDYLAGRNADGSHFREASRHADLPNKRARHHDQHRDCRVADRSAPGGHTSNDRTPLQRQNYDRGQIDRKGSSRRDDDRGHR